MCEGRHIQTKRCGVSHYWRNLQISERLLSLTVYFWLLKPRLLFQAVYLFSFWLTKPLPTFSLSASPTTRQTSLNPAVKYKIFKWWYNRKGIAFWLIQVFLRWEQWLMCIKCIILIFSSCHSWQVQVAKWESNTHLLTRGAIKYGSTQTSIQPTCQEVRKGYSEFTAGPWARTRTRYESAWEHVQCACRQWEC